MEDESDLAFSKCELTLSTPKRRETTSWPELSETKQPANKKCRDDGEEATDGKKEKLSREKIRLAKTWQPAMIASLPQDTKFDNDGEKKLAEQTWLHVTEFGLQCIACKRAGLAGPWCDGTAGANVKDLRMWFVSKHANSKAHVTAVKQILGISAAVAGAPEISEFEAVLKKIQSGASLRNVCDSSFSDKTSLMAWTLQEAVLNEIRDHLADAETISLTRDARRQRLLIRYGACNSKGQSHAGMLGMIRDYGDNAGEIVKATREILKRVCTSHASPPRWYAGPASFFNEELFERIRKHDLNSA